MRYLLAVSIAILTAAALPAQNAPAQRAFLDKYCVACHNSKTKIAGLTLDTADLANVPNNAELWEKVLKKLRTGAMPPLGMPKPEKATVEAFAVSLETSIDKAATLHPNPGRPALHRLNRAEYANAIRDLLALDIDSAAFLPADDASYGFDNVASVLGLSPALQERYIAAAGKISRLAVGDPATSPIVETYRVRSDISQDDHIEGLPLGTRGGVLIHHNFPLDAEYVIKVKLLKSTVDLLFGGNALDETLEIALNGERVKTLTINPKKKEEPKPEVKVASDGFDPAAATRLSMSQPPDSLEARLFVKAGPQTVSVAFMKKTLAPVEDLVEPFQRSTFDPSDPKGLPHVLSVSIGGPFEAKGSGDTPSRRRIFSAIRPPPAKKSPARERFSRPSRGVPTAGRCRTAIWNRCSASTSRAATRATSTAASKWALGASWPARSSSSDLSATRPTSPRTRRIASAIWNWRRACRSSCGAAFPTTNFSTLAAQGKLKDPAVLEQQVAAHAGGFALARRWSDQLRRAVAAICAICKRVAPNPDIVPATSTTTCGRPCSGDRVVPRERHPRRPQRARPAERRLHFRQRTPGAALRHSQHLRQPVPPRHAGRAMRGGGCSGRAAF